MIRCGLLLAVVLFGPATFAEPILVSTTVNVSEFNENIGFGFSVSGSAFQIGLDGGLAGNFLGSSHLQSPLENRFQTWALLPSRNTDPSMGQCRRAF